MSIAPAVSQDQAHFKMSSPEVSEDEAIKCVGVLSASTDPVLVLDFSGVMQILPKAWRVLSLKAAELAKADKKIILLSNHTLSKLIKDKGLDRLFECVERVGGPAQTHVSGHGIKEMVLNVMNAMLTGVMHNLDTSLSMSVTVGKPYLKATKPPHEFDWVASARLQCIPFHGQVLLEFPSATLLALTNRPSGNIPRDWAGECLSIALGQAKVQLNEKGFELKNEIPKIHAKAEFVFDPKAPVITIPLTCAAGVFYLEIITDPHPMA
jgi:hypothetical protein